jgi:hypothetical protein
MIRRGRGISGWVDGDGPGLLLISFFGTAPRAPVYLNVFRIGKAPRPNPRTAA